MPEEGDYLVVGAGFHGDTPRLTFQHGGEFVPFEPLSHTFSITVSNASKRCIGWRDISNGALFTCPTNEQVEGKYEQCRQCMDKTGFNPAFYHATVVSPQQEVRNQEPHILYLAYFGDELVKVGISHAGRGNARLLEQGARQAIILETFPTAPIARSYEARIAALNGIAETVSLRQKKAALKSIVHPDFLEQIVNRIETELSLAFDSKSDLITLDPFFFPSGTPPTLGEAIDTADQGSIGGVCIGMLGSLLFFQYDDSLLFLAIKPLTGYTIHVSHGIQPLDLPSQQMSLF